ncbi:hypothetical protein VTK73DRAFT_10134 [Phialemonium thermophilum]|uniref:Chorismate synthase n=1 Tax=Phialemonium thermophilum TaxID=223376 RepID=A0ABR3VYB7_9PEZI
MTESGGQVGQMARRRAPVHAGRDAQAKRRLVVDVDAVRQVRQRDDIDVVGRVLGRRLHGGRLHQAREAPAVAVDGRVDPVADGHVGSRVRVGGVDGGCGTGRTQQRREKGTGRDESGHHGAESIRSSPVTAVAKIRVGVSLPDGEKRMCGMAAEIKTPRNGGGDANGSTLISGRPYRHDPAILGCDLPRLLGPPAIFAVLVQAGSPSICRYACTYRCSLFASVAPRHQGPG